jgi:hypothetical protein
MWVMTRSKARGFAAKNFGKVKGEGLKESKNPFPFTL